MITTAKLGAWIAITVLSVVFAPQAWAANAVSAKSAAAASTATAAVSASSSAIPEALQKALAQPEGKERDKAEYDAVMEWQKTDPAAALAWAVPRANNVPNQRIVGGVSHAWGKREPAAAVAWALARKPSKNGSNEMLVFHLTIGYWAISDPKAVLAWLDTVPADSSKDFIYYVYMSIPDGWARKDPVASAAWAESVKNDQNRQVAINETAIIWARSQSEDAAVWAKRLPPADLKSVVGPIFDVWHQRDAAKATAWLDSLTLPEETKADLKKKAELKKPKK